MNIIIAGDFTTDGRGLDSIVKKKALSEGVLDILKKSDFCIVNLESPVADDECLPIEKSGPCLRTNTQAINYLKECGFTAVALANNHFCDYGVNGVRKTIEELQINDLDYVGGGRTNDELRRILYVEQSGVVVAFINYCEHEFSIQSSYGSNPLDEMSSFFDINEAKKKADIIIVIVHGGSEGYQLPTPRMQRFYHFLIDMGAHMVVNHHQHCYSGFETYHNSNIYYGLGNFFFDDGNNTRSIWNEGFLLSVDINNKVIESIRQIPYVQCANGQIYVRLMNQQEFVAFQQKTEELNGIINNQIKLQDSFNKFVKEKSKNYYSLFSPYSNRYLRYLCKHGLLPTFITRKKRLQLLNYLECESHRDIMLDTLKEKCYS